MTIFLLHELAKEPLPHAVCGAEVVDSVRILALAGHIVADIAAPLRTPDGWVSQKAVITGITRSGRRMLAVRPPLRRVAGCALNYGARRSAGGA